jgi:Flp pilus assembly protein TadG
MPIANLLAARQPATPDGQIPKARAKRSQRGAVTAELAITLPVLLSLLLLGIWSIGLVILNIQCIDAARDVARAVARGDSPDQAKAIGHRTLPTATITITREATDIHVTVATKPTHTPPLLGPLTPNQLTAQASVQPEPTEQPTEQIPAEAKPAEEIPTKELPDEWTPSEQITAAQIAAGQIPAVQMSAEEMADERMSGVQTTAAVQRSAEGGSIPDPHVEEAL